jgi:hypothetical protein
LARRERAFLWGKDFSEERSEERGKREVLEERGEGEVLVYRSYGF